MTPGREKRRTQFRKLNSLSTGIRGLQAKLALLREESERALNEAEDISELGPSMMIQYESIGQDLKILQQAWAEYLKDECQAAAAGLIVAECAILSLCDPTTIRGGDRPQRISRLDVAML